MEATTFSSAEKNELMNPISVSRENILHKKREIKTLADEGKLREFVTSRATPRRMATGSSLSRKKYNKIRNLRTSASKKEYGKQTYG